MLAIDIIRRALRGLLSAKARTLLTALAISVGAFALTLTLAASNGAESYANTIVSDNFDPTELIIASNGDLFNSTDTSKPQVYNDKFGSVTTAGGGSLQVEKLSQSDLDRIATLPGIESVRPGITLSLQYLTRDGQKKYVATAQAYDDSQKPELLAGAIPERLADSTIVLPEGFLTSLGFTDARQAIGQTVRLAVRQQVDQASIINALTQGDTSALQANPTTAEEANFKIVAVAKTPSTLVQPSAGLYVKINDTDLTRLNDVATKGSENYQKYLLAYAKVSDGTDTGKLAAAQDKVRQAGYGAQSVVDTQKTLTQVIDVLQGIVSVFGLIAVVASVFGVVNTMYISVLQRTREIGLMKALGMHKKDINRLFLFEAALIGLLGGLLGAVTAFVLGTVLNPVISKQLSLGDARLLQFDPVQIIGLIIALMVVAVVAGLLPARKAARLDPIEALRTE